MGPRSDNRGYATSAWRAIRSCSRFNGSTVRQPWLCDLDAAAHAADAPASMGPRLIVTDRQAVVPYRQAGKRLDVNRCRNHSDTAVTQDKLAAANMVTAEPLVRPITVRRR